jgi:DNA-directed RNA polymerase subunit N (RpoN/RPB10)
MADIADFYESEKEKLKDANDKADKKEVDKIYKNFEKIHTGEILNKLGLKRYCCRRNLIANIDMMDVI